MPIKSTPILIVYLNLRKIYVILRWINSFTAVAVTNMDVPLVMHFACYSKALIQFSALLLTSSQLNPPLYTYCPMPIFVSILPHTF